MRPSNDEQIEKGLTELRPEVSERFASELDAWAARLGSAEGTATPPARAGSWFSRLRTRRMLPVLAGATAVLFAVVTVGALEIRDDGVREEFSSGGVDSGNDGGAAGVAPSGTAERTIEPGVADAPAPDIAATSPPIADEKLKPGQERIQERSASMALSTEPGEVDDVADEVVDVVDRHDGIVVSSDVKTSSERGRATFDLRIPTANLQAALADFSDLASVASRDEGTLDVTTPFLTAEERFQDRKAEVAALREQLAEADSTSEIDELRERLRIANLDLVAARNELGSLKERTDYSVVSLTVTGDGDAEGWSLGDAVDTAKNVVEDLVGAILIALAVIVPLGALAFLTWLGWTKLQRRRREGSLD
jgi:hypothetical protein